MTENIILTLNSKNGGVNDTPQDFTITLNNGLNYYEGDYLIALSKANLWYSWYNISTALGNNKFVYNDGATDTTITFPDGNYTVQALDAYIKSQMKANGDTGTDANGNDIFYIQLIPNFNTSKVRIVISGGYSVKFNDGNIYQILGFTNGQTVNSTTEGAVHADITNGINAVLIRCDLVDSSRSIENGSISDVIYSFFPAAPPSTHLEIVPFNRDYVRLNSRYVDSVRMRITDQNGNIIDLNGEPVTYQLSIIKANE